MSMNLNRASYEQLIAEDITWLEQQPRTLEREHILAVLRRSAAFEYGGCPSCEAACRIGRKLDKLSKSRAHK